jgi:serine/threonine-protein kinase
MIATGTTIAGYRIERELGSGGMGTVYEATQLSLDRVVALKVLAPGLGIDDDFRMRFRREAMMQAALEHPSIVPVYEAGESEGRFYIAMRLARAGDLKQLTEDGTLPLERLLAILDQAADALDVAHASGLVHRDVKPQNILIDEDDRAFLADFGLTKGSGDRGVTLTGRFMGSLDYMAPELAHGEPFGAPGDVYAFAAVLVEALTGEVPFPYDTEAAILFAHVTEEPPRVTERRPDLPRALDDVIARGLAKHPEDRPRSAAELMRGVRQALVAPTADPARTGRRRFGETIVEPGGRRLAPVVVPVADERVVPWRRIAVTALAVIAAGLAGAALGRLTHGGGRNTQRGSVQAGPVTLSFPSGDWRQAVTVPTIPGLRLTGANALESTESSRPGTIVVGLAPDAEGAGLLPSALKKQLSSAPTPHAVQMGSTQAIAYRQLPALGVRSRIDLFLAPVSGGAVAVACLTPTVLQSGQGAPDCDSVVGSLRLHGVRALPVGASTAYRLAVASILTRLDGERLAGRGQLAGATRRVEQARGAHLLAGAFASAAARLLRVTPTPFSRPSHLALYGALRKAQRAYNSLALAATAGDTAGFARASSRVDASERNVDRSSARLARLHLP